MLVLTRRIGETIVIGDNVHVKVVRVERGRVCLGITAPATTPVDRQEVREQRLKLVEAFPEQHGAAAPV